MAEALPVLLAGLGGGLVVLALRELTRDLAPDAVAYVGSAVDALRRSGREGRLPSGSERRRLGILAGIALGLGAVLVLGPGVHVALAVLGPWLAGWLLGRQRARYRDRVDADIPTIAGGLADALAAGTSLRGAIADLAPTLEGPARVEIGRVEAEIAVGVPPRRSLAELARRNGSEQLDALVAAMLSQQRSGGDLAALLRRHAEAALARQRAAADARSATAQARLTGGMVAAMPIGAALLVELAAPGFVGSMLAEPAATMLLAVAVGLQLVGFLVIQRFGRAGR